MTTFYGVTEFVSAFYTLRGVSPLTNNPIHSWCRENYARVSVLLPDRLRAKPNITSIRSLTVDHLLFNFGDRDDVAVVYIYCNYKQSLKQSLQNLLGSLLRQLVEQRPTVSEHIRTFYDKFSRPGKSPSEADMLQTLWSEISEYSRVFVVVDALDESSETGLDLLEKFEDPLPGNIKLLVTSRPLPNIKEHFEGKRRVEISATPEDVARYVRARIRTSNKYGLRKIVQGKPGTEDKIVDAIINNVKGM
jgi:hypothetical protein